MIKSMVIAFLAGAAVIGNIYVLIKWRHLRARGPRNLAIASLACLVIVVLLAFDLFTQIWLARANSISGPLFLSFGPSSVIISAVAVVILAASDRKRRQFPDGAGESKRLYGTR